MASDLIYREDAKDFVRYAYHKGLNPVEYLDEVPADDVRPVVLGQWKMRKNWSRCVCSVCLWESVTAYHFCPNCGADMREVKADG